MVGLSAQCQYLSLQPRGVSPLCYALAGLPTTLVLLLLVSKANTQLLQLVDKVSSSGTKLEVLVKHPTIEDTLNSWFQQLTSCSCHRESHPWDSSSCACEMSPALSKSMTMKHVPYCPCPGASICCGSTLPSQHHWSFEPPSLRQLQGSHLCL